jgi:hypothetical protein
MKVTREELKTIILESKINFVSSGTPTPPPPPPSGSA